MENSWEQLFTRTEIELELLIVVLELSVELNFILGDKFFAYVAILIIEVLVVFWVDTVSFNKLLVWMITFCVNMVESDDVVSFFVIKEVLLDSSQ